jgi:hypothetical protein
MPGKLPKIIIQGITLDGVVFRPSDWIERLIDTLFSYGEDRRTRTGPYSGPDRRRRQVGFLRAQMIDGRKCLVVDTRLRDANPAAYRFLLEFIENNRLQMQEAGRANPTSTGPA